ncbi:protoporphyrinogen oxidase HemJ [Helicobacter sp. 11S02629-2]|uniref:protoporphyrinogen oxidase HemJ n=1 Tax=Helicobacter sp. 11S02629-2 TaxID=1476195 RepID=UPI000BA74101|nr:protoporphyrinogen oxidase HemJ [Helicobacter sp. 11S02629-2]PAF45496.1 TIGR00701 family protein [Helicobacter sp. 11S02629-2]
MEFYSYVLALHLLFLISWMATLFYLPRLFVYHVENMTLADYVKVVRVQEHKLYYYIGWPALVLTVITGVILIGINPSIMTSGGFMHVKLLCVVLLIIYHFMCGNYVKKFRTNNVKRSSKFFRIFNEVPTILLIIIVYMIVIRPF